MVPAAAAAWTIPLSSMTQAAADFPIERDVDDLLAGKPVVVDASGVEASTAPAISAVKGRAGALPTPVGIEPGMLFFGANRRSGTTWLAAILNAHPEISCRNEGWLLTGGNASAENWIDREAVRRWRGLAAPSGTYLPFLGVEGLERAMLRGMIREVVKQCVLAEGWKDYSRLRWMGDKTTTHYCTKVELLHELFPDARFVYMLRDGRDVVVSDMFLAFRDDEVSATWGMTPAQIRDVARAREYHFLRRGSPAPLFTPDTMRYFAGNWVKCVTGGLRARDLYQDRFFEVRYERMVADPEAMVRGLYTWLGAGFDDAFIAHVIEQNRFEVFSGGRKRGQVDPRAEWRRGVSGDWVNYFTEEDKHLFKQIAGGLLVELGYENNLTW